MRVTPLGAGLLAALWLGGCAAPEERTDVPYDTRFGDATTMDLYLPGDSGAHPAVMLVHGGGWSGGDSKALEATGQRLARTGYVAASINYRLVPDAIFPAQAQDCLCALSFLRAHAGELDIDPDRIAVMGYSAGGHLVSLIGLAADAPEIAPDCEWGPTGPPRAVIDGAGPSDLTWGRGIDAVENFLGGTLDEIPGTYVMASPMGHIHAGAPPFLLIHGGGDLFVPIDQSERFRDALVAAGDDASLLDVSGGGHLINPDVSGDLAAGVSTDTPEAWLALADFLRRTIGEP